MFFRQALLELIRSTMSFCVYCCMMRSCLHVFSIKASLLTRSRVDVHVHTGPTSRSFRNGVHPRELTARGGRLYNPSGPKPDLYLSVIFPLKRPNR